MSAPDRRSRRGRLIVAAGLIGVILTPPVAPARRAATEWLRRRRSFTDPVAPFLDAPCHAVSNGAPPTAVEAEVAP